MLLVILPVFAQTYDVIVYGSSSSGVIAAVQSASMGKKTLLISTDKHLGGLTASGLGATDMNKCNLIGGLSRTFYQRVYKYYMSPGAWKSDIRDDYFQNLEKKIFGGKNESFQMQWVFEPKVAQKIFTEMLGEAKVEIVYNKRLILKKDAVKKKNRKIQSIQMESGESYTAKMYIDATYEGDLMAKAGVSYTIGRESNSQYGETVNGIHPSKVVSVLSDGSSIDPYIKKGNPTSGLLPFIEPKPLGKTGDADNRTQAYCYRFTLSKDSLNKRPIEKPKNYNPLWFEIYARMFEQKKSMKLPLTLSILPNKKTDTNHADFIGASYGWAEGNYKQRDEIAQMHKDFALGKVWFLGNDPRVPKRIRDEMKQYGLPNDEFIDSDNFPFQIYVRESRRMVGDYVMKEQNVVGTEIASESVGLGSYWLDSHVVSQFVDEEGKLWLEGTFWKSSGAYPIAYKSIVPKAKECTNLLVPVCLSSTHAAYGSIRMEPVYMVLGQSAATAACLAIDEQIEIQALPYFKLEQRLLADKQILQKP
jgi:hypothetical protein